MIEINNLSSYYGLFLVLLMIFSGRAFREIWKSKQNDWVLKSWMYGLISLSSFLGLFFIPFNMQ